MNTILKLQVPLKTGNFFTSWATIISSSNYSDVSWYALLKQCL